MDILSVVGVPQPAHRIGPEARVTGTLRVKEPLVIEGRFEGRIEGGSVVAVASGAMVRADIVADAVVIAGRVEGDVEASSKVYLFSGCEMYGSIRTARISIADDAVFEGSCEMLRAPDEIDIFAYTVDQLRYSLKKVK
ncbi:protein of unknown function DUF583 [Spirochaeta thermophila DSM 6578]|uniref:Polymer-forming cytoskeletal protein n=1 Tax=Winmispira thermophila (strain ATCC 700085 / DSM 6578 / Z-1203) TaxID=869211 RepID=G0GEG1_WINT7|nr:polymer-forming cytoskeletal protein [Spirochaeta thermophila]AEJ62298.1 protein of unknown function DUF583 [Spirochaeta thermophila DSM 6578]